MLVIAMGAFVLLVFYFFSIFYMEDRRVEKHVKANLLTLVIIYCPIINTVL